MKITETDYETVEKEVERYQCDHCKMVFDKSDVNDVWVRKPTGSRKEMHLCDSCTNIREAFQFEKKRASVKDRWEWFGKELSSTPTIFAAGLFVGGGIVFFAGNTHPAEAATLGTIMQEVFFGALFTGAFLFFYTLALYMWGWDV